MIDLTPTTARTAALAANVDDSQLSDPTPIDAPVSQLLHHLLGLTVAFHDAAAKIEGPTTNTPPAPTTGPLPDGWRDLLAQRLAELGAAWQDPAAWDGMTMAGGVRFPAEVCGLVAMDEVLLHGWDLAVATGQAYQPSREELEAILPIVTPNPDPEAAAAEREGMFGEPVTVREDAPLLDRVLGLAGRDPAWSAAG
ncbi:TIGR03086 family metal-binding protein [Ruania halotolerans]|uniref:TIGR03086 family metal-binding protein n=1 Tax=Ruania halotolerans TaxID=2897773 RepID=UPI001E3333BB|nr:TIGR03086 family metal-binding protein [Ruania halotolerans]UFU06086.1 TIGR03086 family metal-binding protein [Ruania halotolerans]